MARENCNHSLLFARTLVTGPVLCYIRGHETRRYFYAVLACKLSRVAIRLLGRGGTDFPGRIALKLCPNLLGELAKNVTTVIVTGTNGKTTTSRMIEQSWARRWNFLLCQQVRRKPAQRRDRRVRHARLPVRQVPLYARADRVGRGGVQGDLHVRRREGRRGDEPLPRPARPLRRGHAHAGEHQDRHQPQPERDALPERGRFALHVDPRRF